MERTPELDLHWHDAFYCVGCQFYTGQLEQHEGHLVIALPRLMYVGESEIAAYRVVVGGQAKRMGER